MLNLILRSCGLLLISSYLLLAACTGSDGELILGSAAPGLQNDEPDNTPVVFEDFAGAIYAVSGQWLCSVSGSFGSTDDQLVFNANGTANFQRFGSIFWNRDLPNNALTLHTDQNGILSLHNIFAGNGALQFNLDLSADQTLTTDEVYACVLSAG